MQEVTLGLKLAIEHPHIIFARCLDVFKKEPPLSPLLSPYLFSFFVYSTVWISISLCGFLKLRVVLFLLNTKGPMAY